MWTRNHAVFQATCVWSKCGLEVLGKHLITHWSNTQGVIALSSAEAELYGVVRGSIQGIGLRSMAADLGEILELEVLTDSSAATGICRRKGIGKVRHLDTNLLWVQDKIKDGTLALICNPVAKGRTPLSVLLSTDNGLTWPRRLDLEKEAGEFSYPAIIATKVGLAITYTWKRKRIAFWMGSVEQIPEASI